MPALTRASQDCPRIVSNIERLACFDQAAGTPGFTPHRQWSAQELEAPTLRRVLIHETGRAPEDLMFRLRSEEGGLLISAPAIASVAPHPYLIISCVQNISRLQLVTAQGLQAQTNYKLGTQLPYLFIVNRLAHYIKVLQREQIGSWKERRDLESELNKWIKQYVADQENPSADVRSRRPLRAARVEVSDVAGDPGWYQVSLAVRPHFKYMGANFEISLVGRLDTQ
ncbi:type VI secretion system-associated protein TagO [Pseudomonas sp. KCJK9058]|uniref:type VI secretion system-associated protein TagO n=1 Tax=Pseudomonas sp. KCJK9058 TaxID=3344563 RepID=UPI00390590A2